MADGNHLFKGMHQGLVIPVFADDSGMICTLHARQRGVPGRCPENGYARQVSKPYSVSMCYKGIGVWPGAGGGAARQGSHEEIRDGGKGCRVHGWEVNAAVRKNGPSLSRRFAGDDSGGFGPR
jgi:hypothetical protein